MGLRVAEYLGNRTDDDSVLIQPAQAQSNCPFMQHICPKILNHKEPVCSVRKPDGNLWITCKDRLCSTRKNIPLIQYQKNILLTIAKTVFVPNAQQNEVFVRREVPMQVYEGTNYNADYIMTYSNGRNPNAGPDRIVCELQGGGETSNTGLITNSVVNWRSNPNRTNSELRQTVQGVGTLETNAWRRQQEQFIVKGNIAMKTWKGLGIAFCVGAPLYDYLMNKLSNANLPNLRNHNWTLAIIGFKEDTSVPVAPGPIPLLVDVQRMLFTNYQTFVQALINQGEPSPDAFAGEYINLNGEVIHLPWN